MSEQNDQREPDLALASQPLTKLEAYFLFSTMKRMMVAYTQFLISHDKKDADDMVVRAADIRDVSAEVNALIDRLVYPQEGGSA